MLQFTALVGRNLQIPALPKVPIGRAAIESDGNIGRSQAHALGTTNLQRLLVVENNGAIGDLVTYRGGECFDFASRALAVVSPARETVDVFVDPRDPVLGHRL